MRVAGLDSVRYRSRKPPAAAWLAAEQVVDLDRLDRRAVLYRGTAGEAALRFPQNANVAAAVALAASASTPQRSNSSPDPEATGNIHEIEAEGAPPLCDPTAGQAVPNQSETSALARSALRARCSTRKRRSSYDAFPRVTSAHQCLRRSSGRAGIEDLRFSARRAIVDDLTRPGLLHAVILRSTMRTAHRAIDATAGGRCRACTPSSRRPISAPWCRPSRCVRSCCRH